MKKNPIPALAAKIAARTSGELDPFTFGYTTTGGTYVVASSGLWNDDGLPHDLIIVLPYYGILGAERVFPVRPTVNPDLVTAVREALAGDGQR